MPPQAGRCSSTWMTFRTEALWYAGLTSERRKREVVVRHVPANQIVDAFFRRGPARPKGLPGDRPAGAREIAADQQAGAIGAELGRPRPARHIGLRALD